MRNCGTAIKISYSGLPGIRKDSTHCQSQAKSLIPDDSLILKEKSLKDDEIKLRTEIILSRAFTRA